MTLANNYLAKTFVKNAIMEICIKNGWYVCGDVDAYSRLLEMSVGGVNDNVRDAMARDISEHSEDAALSDVRKALDVIYSYAILMYDLTEDE